MEARTRRFVLSFALAVMAAVVTATTGSLGATAGSGSSGVKDEGVGTYTDASVGNQISNFTINREMVSCGVGTVAGGQLSGPFAMLMYATRIASYNADHATGIIRASGRMRSITEVGGATAEDVEHDFLAISADNRGVAPDRFDVHFRTPFWNPANPLCTPSGVVAGGCRFGGELLMGDVAVGA